MAPETDATERAVRRGGSLVAALLAALALWAVVPVVFAVVRLVAYGDAPTGADGPLSGDQLQYLAWVRDAGSHGLASNLFCAPAPMSSRIRCSPSGLLWRLGVPLEVAYWIWKPVAVATLFAGALGWRAPAARRAPGAGRGGRARPVLVYADRGAGRLAELGSAAGQEHVVSTTWELFGAGSLWGYMPTAIAIGHGGGGAGGRAGARPGQAPGGARLVRGVGRRGRVVMSWLHLRQGDHAPGARRAGCLARRPGRAPARSSSSLRLA